MSSDPDSTYPDPDSTDPDPPDPDTAVPAPAPAPDTAVPAPAPAPENPDEEKAKAEVFLESKIMNSKIVKLYNKCIGTDKDIIENYGTQVTVTTYSRLNL